MKKFKTLLLVICLLPAAQGANAPRGSFTAGEYEAAKAEAMESGKPIAIVITELKSDCPKCMAGNEAVFKQMRTDYVLVIDDKTAKGRLPEMVKQSTYPIYKSKGNIIPIVAVLSQTDGKLLGGLCYKQISGDGKKAFKTLETEIAGKIAKVPATTSVPIADDKKSSAVNASGGMREWMNSEGKSIKAEAISSNETSVTLKLENGKVVDYPLEKLSEESRKLVSEAVKSN